MLGYLLFFCLGGHSASFDILLPPLLLGRKEGGEEQFRFTAVIARAAGKKHLNFSFGRKAVPFARNVCGLKVNNFVVIVLYWLTTLDTHICEKRLGIVSFEAFVGPTCTGMCTEQKYQL